MKIPHSLRGQLTLAFTAIATLIVVAAAAGMMQLIEYALWAPLDAALREEAETLTMIRGTESPAALARAVADLSSEREPGPQKFIRVIAADGRTLATSGALSSAPPDEPTIASHITHYAIAGLGDDAYRLAWYAVPDGGWVEIGVRATRQIQTLRRARLVIAGAAAILLMTLAGLAWTITTRATADLARVAAELETIEAGSLDRRLASRRTTEVDRLASVLNRLLARLDAAMSHLRRFTADAAHELRTPIAALRAHLEVAIGSSRSVEGYRNGLLDALEQTERLGRLAEDLLTLSAVESGSGEPARRAEPVRVDELVREVAESLEPMAQEQGRCFVASADRPATVLGAAALLKRLVLNIVDNAFRHTPATARVSLTLRSQDGMATLEVRDEGPGIAPADLPLVFERFRRGSQASAGTGLGLALCREIVARHGGNIRLDSAPGRGTTVIVTLPLANGNPNMR